MYNNLKELYALFIESHSSIKIGFSKCVSLRPKHCIFAGASGTHTVCACVYHENVNLMIEAADISKITNNFSVYLRNFTDCIQMITCKEATSNNYKSNNN